MTAHLRSTSADKRLDRLFHAMADTTRRRLLARLAEGPGSIGALAEPFKMSFPAVSKHVRVLERAGLVRRAIDGRVHRCSLNAAPLRDAELWLTQYRAFWEASLESLARYVEDDHVRRRR